jgi:hypothetical protein
VDLGGARLEDEDVAAFLFKGSRSLTMRRPRRLVVKARRMPGWSRLRASVCQATVFASSFWQRHLNWFDARPAASIRKLLEGEYGYHFDCKPWV